MKHYPNMYTEWDEKKKEGRCNAWEQYFEQPGGVMLDHAMKGKNVILSNMEWSWFDRIRNENRMNDKEKYEIYKKYIRINDKTADYLSRKYIELFPKSESILGVVARGTDYTEKKPSKHAIMPTVGQLTQKCREMMERYSLKHIFLATEDKNNYEYFINYFGSGSIIVNDTKRYSNTGDKFLAAIRDDRDGGCYLRGLEYITTLFLLGKCSYLTGGHCGATMYATMVNPDLKDIYIFELGAYD